MTFLAPAVLAALAALSLPVLIHLLQRFRVRVLKWAATRFLSAALRRRQRRMRLADLLLLLLRCAALAALILAFARPVIDQAAGPSGPVRLALIIDRSASMQTQDGVETRFERARRLALADIAALPTGSEVLLFLADSRSHPLISRPTGDITLARRLLEGSAAGADTVDLLPALQAASAALSAPGSLPARLRLYTDGQLHGWDQLPGLRATLAAAPAPLELVLVREDSPPTNLALTDLAITPETPEPGSAALLTVKVHNAAAATALNVRLTAALAGRPPSSEARIEQIPANTSATATLSVALPATGPTAVTVSLPDDALGVDNHRSIALELLPPRPLVVLSAPRRPGVPPPSVFLVAAIGDKRPAEVRPLADLATMDLMPYAAVAILGSPLAGSAPRLIDYVRAGGSLLLFPDRADSVTGPGWSELLPAALGAARDDILSLAAPPYAHPVAAPWNDRVAGRITNVNTVRHFPLAPAAEGEVVLAFSDGSPALVAKRLDQGRVALAAFPLDPDWTNLPRHPAIVPIVDRLLAWLVAQPAPQLDLSIGQDTRLRFPIARLNSEVTHITPDDRRAGIGRLMPEEGAAVIVVQNTEIPGVHRILLDAQTEASALIAVNPDPRESTAQTIPAGLLGELNLQASSTTEGPAPAGLLGALTASRLWAALLLLGGLLLIAELAVSFASSPRRSEPSDLS